MKNLFILLLGLDLKANDRKKKGIYLKDKKINLIKFLVIFLIVQTVAAQENFVTNGDEILSTNGSVTYTIGQLFYQDTQISDESVQLNTGVQIPYSSYVFINPSRTKLDITAYPNPTIDKLTVEIKDYNDEKLTIYISAVNGSFIEKTIITEKQTIINMQNWSTGIYLFHVVGRGFQRNLKIIKD